VRPDLHDEPGQRQVEGDIARNLTRSVSVPFDAAAAMLSCWSMSELPMAANAITMEMIWR
jgi:hypothetical protein